MPLGIPKDYHLVSSQAIKRIRRNGYALQRIPTAQRTPELCLAAVESNGIALEYVPEKLRTAKVCEAAVRQNSEALIYVPDALLKQMRAFAAELRRERQQESFAHHWKAAEARQILAVGKGSLSFEDGILTFESGLQTSLKDIQNVPAQDLLLVVVDDGGLPHEHTTGEGPYKEYRVLQSDSEDMQEFSPQWKPLLEKAFGDRQDWPACISIEGEDAAGDQPARPSF